MLSLHTGSVYWLSWVFVEYWLPQQMVLGLLWGLQKPCLTTHKLTYRHTHTLHFSLWLLCYIKIYVSTIKIPSFNLRSDVIWTWLFYLYMYVCYMVCMCVVTSVCVLQHMHSDQLTTSSILFPPPLDIISSSPLCPPEQLTLKTYGIQESFKHSPPSTFLLPTGVLGLQICTYWIQL